MTNGKCRRQRHQRCRCERRGNLIVRWEDSWSPVKWLAKYPIEHDLYTLQLFPLSFHSVWFFHCSNFSLPHPLLFPILEHSLRFSTILYDSLWFSTILYDSQRFSMILYDTWQPFSYRFSRFLATVMRFFHLENPISWIVCLNLVFSDHFLETFLSRAATSSWLTTSLHQRWSFAAFIFPFYLFIFSIFLYFLFFFFAARHFSCSWVNRKHKATLLKTLHPHKVGWS